MPIRPEICSTCWRRCARMRTRRPCAPGTEPAGVPARPDGSRWQPERVMGFDRTAGMRHMWIVPDWPRPPNVRVVTTTREGPSRSDYGFNLGTRCGDDPAAVAEKRSFLREVLLLPSEPCWLQQVHGTRVVTLDSPLQREGDRSQPDHEAADRGCAGMPEADAVVT